MALDRGTLNSSKVNSSTQASFSSEVVVRLSTNGVSAWCFLVVRGRLVDSNLSSLVESAIFCEQLVKVGLGFKIDISKRNGVCLLARSKPDLSHRDTLEVDKLAKVFNTRGRREIADEANLWLAWR